MGDNAEMMLDGTLCNVCGTIVASESGLPTNCGCDESQDNIEKDMTEKAIYERMDRLGWETK